MDITAQFDALRLRKEQIEYVLNALRPMLGLSESDDELSTAYASAGSSEHMDFTFTQVSGPTGESIQVTTEAPAEPVATEATAEQLAYFGQTSTDPFQKRIDDALWGWQQRPEGLLSPI